MVIHQLIFSSSGQQSRSCQWNLGISSTQNLNSQNYLSLLVTPEDVTSNNPELDQQPTILTNNIPPVIVTNDESLAAIFPFELEEITSVLLFSRAALEKKPITAMYTDAKVDGHSIKLILDNGSTTQELQLSQNGQHMQVLAMCGHFKPNHITTSMPLIDLEEEKLKPTWEAYQASWADVDHNELPPIFTWNDNNKGKKEQRKESTCETTIDTWTNNKNHHKLPPILLWDNNPKGKQRKELT
ncbi:hypothetical protein G9A89_017151 [Geosiphon pyriformis]|nr:hypothetical protein G9A89_017151 [Geosiphon pyriformis]